MKLSACGYLSKRSLSWRWQSGVWLAALKRETIRSLAASCGASATGGALAAIGVAICKLIFN